MIEVDYIIVGQGLAGSAVSAQLIWRNKKIVVFDDAAANNSSRIAAGIFNPITGKKMVKTWLADTLFPTLHSFYRKLEIASHLRFFYPLPLYRPFISAEEQNEWMARSIEAAYDGYIDRIVTDPFVPGVSDPFGGLLLKNSGYVDTKVYVDAVGTLIKRHATLRTESIDTNGLEVSERAVRYGEYQAKGVIICSGAHQTKWFKWLPIRALKGETISVRHNFSEKMIVNRGVYAVPSGEDGLWRVGSTYNFRDRGEEITAEARKELKEKFQGLFTNSFEVEGQQWGFRPTTPDRRPIIGRHPEYANVIAFNGLGTKGVSLAPYFSEVLVHWLENERELQKEVDIERFKSLYWDSPE